jgi:hypothetical protein
VQTNTQCGARWGGGGGGGWWVVGEVVLDLQFIKFVELFCEKNKKTVLASFEMCGGECGAVVN